MNSTVFITGDRTPTVAYPLLVALELMRALKEGQKIVTTDATGVAACVRDLARMADVEVDVIPLPANKESYPDYHLAVANAFNPDFVAIHVDPHSSSIIMSLIAMTHADDNLRIVTHADLTV
jgi:hypothetical protein